MRDHHAFRAAGCPAGVGKPADRLGVALVHQRRGLDGRHLGKHVARALHRPERQQVFQADDARFQRTPAFGEFQFNKVWSSLAPTLSTSYARTAVFSDADTDITQNMIPMLSGDTSIADGMKSLGDMVREANQRYQ